MLLQCYSLIRTNAPSGPAVPPLLLKPLTLCPAPRQRPEKYKQLYVCHIKRGKRWKRRMHIKEIGGAGTKIVGKWKEKERVISRIWLRHISPGHVSVSMSYSPPAERINQWGKLSRLKQRSIFNFLHL